MQNSKRQVVVGLLLILVAVTALTSFFIARRRPQPVVASPSVSLNNPGPSPTPAPPLASPEPVTGFGIMGDSISDEYRADDNRGGPDAATTLNWMEQLVLRRGLNFGPWGTWGEPRRAGYKYNWARSAATAHSLITSGQHVGLAQQVADGEVSHVIVWIGANDFAAWNGTYAQIYDGTMNDADLQTKVDQMIADITTAVDIVLKAGKVQMVIVTVGDIGLAPDTVATFPDPAKRQRATETINKVNAGIQAMAAARGVTVVDVNDILASAQLRADSNGQLHIGDEQINFLGKGNDPHAGRLDDSVGHAGTVLSGLIANTIFVEPFDSRYGLNIVPLNDAEILEDAGLPTPTAAPR